MSSSPIYLDYNATTPVDPAVAEAMLPYLHEHFGNPSSTHSYGVTTKQAVEAARGHVAALIGARPEEILFTSGGSESNNTAILGVARSLAKQGRHIITSAVEHPAVLEPCHALQAEGFQITVLPVDDTGRVDPDEVALAITPQTILITIMHANNEVGTIQPIAEIAAIAKEKRILFHTDAAQSVGKIPVHVDTLGVDFLSMAGHKLYAPKGVGALYIRSGRTLPKLIHGGAHESGRRAGTENVLLVAGLGKACEVAADQLPLMAAHSEDLRDRLWDSLAAAAPSCQRNGDPANCLPNTLSVSFPNVDATTLLAEIEDRVAASAGAACHADGVNLSTVLEAMNVPLEFAMGTVRLSVGRYTNPAEIDDAAQVLAAAASRLAGSTPVDSGPSEENGEIRLTRFTRGLGCACKLRPQDLERVLQALPVPDDPAVMVGTSTADDAAVYKLRDDLAVVQTVDFFTPVVDDPYDFGAISAANSLSDLYAMGAEPRFALSVVGFPPQRLPLSVLQKILEGASDVAREAGISIIGGHSVEDMEPKFGLAVTGVAHPDRILSNSSAREEDVLVLTKPIGSGIVATAIKRGIAEPDVARAAIDTMRALNRDAAQAMVDFDIHSCTDVTGFGLLGHLREMAEGSGVDVALDFDRIPLLPGARSLATADVVPGGSLDNLEHVSPHVAWHEVRSQIDKILLADAQTSGGLLVALAPEDADAFLAALAQRGVEKATRIGQFGSSGPGRISV
jgi:cysteine desulfurase NifS/selenium donor protein